MKILMTAMALDIGGAETHVLELSRSLKSMGHDVTVASNGGVYVAELDFEAMFACHESEAHYKPLPKFPALTRDFSFVCDESLEVGTIENVIKKSGVSTLESVKLFDVYRGAQIGENKKSVSFSVSLRASDRTLNDTEADGAVKKILKALERELGITLRA